jgi:hypothetical protein
MLLTTLGAPPSAHAQYAEQTGADNPFDGVTAPSTPAALDAVAGDFDTDGDVDLLAYDGTTERFYANDSTGTYAEQTGSSNPFDGVSPAFGTRGRTFVRDVDGDEDLDLVTFDYTGGGSGTLVLVENTDGSTYARRTGSNNPFDGIPVSGNPASVDAVMGDFSGDSAPDLLVYDGSTERYYENDGSGSFTEQTGPDNPFDGLATAFWTKATTLVRDFDGDGDADLAFRDGTGDATAWRYREHTDTGFAARTGSDNPLSGVAADATAKSVAATAGDYDIDGAVELVTYDGGTQRYYDGAGGTFVEETSGANPFDDGGADPALQVKANTIARDADADADVDQTFGGTTLGADALRFVERTGAPAVQTISGTDGTGNDTGWRMLSVPAAGATRGDLDDDIVFATSSGSMLYRWDPDGTSDTWVEQTEASDPLPRGEGFILYFFDDDTDEITAEGRRFDVPPGGEDPSADFTISGLDPGDRFEVLGNPYDVTYDLGGLAGGDLPGAGFQNTVQVWDPTVGSAGAFIPLTQNDLSTGGDRIPAWNGFILERTVTGSGQSSLTFMTDGKKSGAGSLLGSKRQMRASAASRPKNGGDTVPAHSEVEVRLAVTNTEEDTVGTDRGTLWLDDRASAGWDGYEATDFPPPAQETYVSATFPISRSGELVHRALASEPHPTGGSAEVRVPLAVRGVGTGGTATLTAPAALPDGSGWAVDLHDTAADTTVDLRASGYTFALDPGGSISSPSQARFRLRVTSDPLPVELARFDGTSTDEDVVLRWTTASETGNAGFRVLRTEAGRDASWTAIGYVEGSGTTAEARTYQFTDSNLPYAADTLRYRLRQVDTEGGTSVSDPVRIGREEPETMELLGTAPNPARQQATVRYALPASSDGATLRLYDVMGRRVRTVEARAEAGRHRHRLDVRELASGVYVLRLTADGQTRTRKLTVVQ